MGDDLDPDRVTDLLGCTPTRSQRKGDVITGRISRVSRIAKIGMWSLDASDREPENLDAQIAEILERLTPDLAAWGELSGRYKIDLFCGFFMRMSNEGLEISAQSLVALGQRGITLGMDIYSPTQKI